MIKWSEHSKKYGRLLAGMTVALAAIFCLLLWQTWNRVEPVPKASSDLDSWTIEKSALNGAALEENKNIYISDEEGRLATAYITVFPTESAEYGSIDLSAFDLHENHNKAYNPVLDINITLGDNDGNLPLLISTDAVNGRIRVRGNSARGEKYKSYNVKITDEDSQGLYGMKTLNLNKHVRDVSKVANKLAFDIMKTMDNMVSMRTSFVRVYMKDAALPKEEQVFVYMGLYTHVEQPNKAFLTAHGLDPNGTLYKANMFEFRKRKELVNVDDPAYDEVAFETVLGIREGTDHTKFLQMLDDVNNLNLDFEEVFDKHFNEENYLTWLACNILLGSEDIISHNFLLYNPSNTLTWYFIPWDYDKIFKLSNFDVDRNTSPIAITKGIQKYSGVQLHGRYLKQPGNIEKVTAKMDELMKNYFQEEDLLPLIDLYRPVLEQTITKAPDVGMLFFEPSRMNEYLNQFPKYIKKNYDDYITTLQYPLPFFTAEPVRQMDGKVKFAWAPSFDFQGDFIKYTIKVTRDYKSTDVVFEAADLISTEYIFEGELPPGTYYLDIKAIDSKGNIQYSHDVFNDEVAPYFAYGLRKVVIS